MSRGELRRVFRTACKVLRAAFPSGLKRQIVVWAISVLFFAASVQAQTGDWRMVENLKPGSRVRVRTDAQRRIQCSVEGATDTELICEVHVRRSLRTSTLSIPRSEIQEVHVLPNPDQAKDAAIGAAIGAGAGATGGAINARVARGAYGFFGALAGAGIGALIGASVPVFQVIFQRSKLIYKR
jgi:hypothetical protein